MDEIISYKPCAVKVRNAKLRDYLKRLFLGRASPKTKITVHFIVNIMIFECLLFEEYSCKRLQTWSTY
jgi:hypothetical protein